MVSASHSWDVEQVRCVAVGSGEVFVDAALLRTANCVLGESFIVRTGSLTTPVLYYLIIISIYMLPFYYL